jgi:hypothetical protein
MSPRSATGHRPGAAPWSTIRARLGPQFVYDEASLTASLLMTGFFKIKRMALNVSEDPELQGLEHVERLPPGFLELETMTLEGVNIREQ